MHAREGVLVVVVARQRLSLDGHSLDVVTGEDSDPSFESFASELERRASETAEVHLAAQLSRQIGSQEHLLSDRKRLTAAWPLEVVTDVEVAAGQRTARDAAAEGVGRDYPTASEEAIREATEPIEEGWVHLVHASKVATSRSQRDRDALPRQDQDA